MLTWKQHGTDWALYMGSLGSPSVYAVRANTESVGSHRYKLYGWALPGVVCPETAFDSLQDAQARAEQLIELWMHRAELEET